MITEDQKKDICKLAGVEYEKKCKHYKKKTCTGEYECDRIDCDETEIDLNILMKSVFNVNLACKYGFVIAMDKVIVNTLDMDDKPIGQLSFEEFYYNYHNSETEAITEALCYVIKESE